MAFGKDQDARTAGSTGGSARTGAKVEAARQNGAKGGRPREKKVSCVVEATDRRAVTIASITKTKVKCSSCRTILNRETA
jgi:hypothetical protein